MDQFIQQTINGLATGSVLALVGLGVTLLWGVLGVMNFAQANLVTCGGVVAWFAVRAGWPAPLAVVGAMVATAVVAGVLNFVVVEPLRRRRAPEFAYVVATIGAGLIITELIRWKFGALQQNFPRTGFPSGNFAVGGVIIPKLQVMILVVAAAVMTALVLWLRRTANGRATRTVAYSREVAALMGVRSQYIYVTIFAVSGALAALSGVFLAVDTAQLTYNYGDLILLSALTVVVVGGMGSPGGAMVGGLVLGLCQVYATAYVSSVFGHAISMILILGFLMLRPRGLFGAQESERV